MDHREQAARAQAGRWNGPSGQAWVDLQAWLDAMFQPVEAVLTEAARAVAARRVLDIGCGTGATTLAMAALPSVEACLGVDVSAPMIAAARARAEATHSPATFLQADAQTYMFEPGAFDLLVSRFGVMFFGDPVRAFANLRRAGRPGAPLCAVAWRDPAENDFMTLAERAAAPFLPALPPRDPDAPGQFAFADAGRVRRMLHDSGWGEVDVQPIDLPCRLPEPALLPYLSRMGPLGQALGALPAPARRTALAAVRAAFDPFVYEGEARFSAACWRIAARVPAGAAGSA